MNRFGSVALQILGFGVIATYLAGALGLLHWFPWTDRVTLALVFAIGPVAIVAVLGIHGRISAISPSARLHVATVFLVIAFALFNLMLVVQQMVRSQFRQFRSETTDPGALDALDTAFRVTNLVQLGIDVSFDIFYCLGLVLLSSVMYHLPDFGRALGALGVVSGAALLMFNLATFPHPPAESGLVDLGPVTGVWWLLVIMQMKRKKAHEAVSGDAAAAERRDAPDKARS